MLHVDFHYRHSFAGLHIICIFPFLVHLHACNVHKLDEEEAIGGIAMVLEVGHPYIADPCKAIIL
jgi:hypothetical protein